MKAKRKQTKESRHQLTSTTLVQREPEKRQAHTHTHRMNDEREKNTAKIFIFTSIMVNLIYMFRMASVAKAFSKKKTIGDAHINIIMRAFAHIILFDVGPLVFFFLVRKIKFI